MFEYKSAIVCRKPQKLYQLANKLLITQMTRSDLVLQRLNRASIKLGALHETHYNSDQNRYLGSWSENTVRQLSSKDINQSVTQDLD